jgi:uncharacterized iron-regulated protein
MKKLAIIFIANLMAIAAISQNKTAYQLFNGNGKKVQYKKVLKDIQKADIILFGELHNNPIAHWLQYEISYDIVQSEPMVFGAEMFEADNQNQLNLYLNDSIDYKGLDTLARLWPNFKTDYKPLVDLAKMHKQPFIATNIPRRYANMVYKQGFEVLETITDEEKQWVAPLPIEYDPELPGYKNMLSMMGGHAGENFPKAQAIKDATMAYFISENYRSNSKFIHYHGTYHSDNYEGIVWYLKRLLPDAKILTISTVSQPDANKLSEENKGKADYIICVDENMTTTY